TPAGASSSGSSPTCASSTSRRTASSLSSSLPALTRGRSGLRPSRRSRFSSPGAARGQQAAVERLGDGGGAVGDTELGVDVQQVRLHGGLADEQPRRRLTVGGPRGDQSEHFKFPVAQQF